MGLNNLYLPFAKILMSTSPFLFVQGFPIGTHMKKECESLLLWPFDKDQNNRGMFKIYLSPVFAKFPYAV